MLSFNPINPIDQMGFIFYTKKESGTEILASQLSLGCRARRSG